MYKQAFITYARNLPWDRDAEWFGEDPQHAWDDCPRGSWLMWAAVYGPHPSPREQILRAVRESVRKTQPFASGLPVRYRELNELVNSSDQGDGYLKVQRDKLSRAHRSADQYDPAKFPAWQWEQSVLDSVRVILGDTSRAYSAVWYAEEVIPNGHNLSVIVRHHIPVQRFTKGS